MRYAIYNGSITAHCCFKFTVVDTTKPEIIDGKHYSDEGGPHYEAVCECFTRESAELVCAALNAKEG